MKNPVATIDIGSNAVRLVIYDGLGRAPVRIHNERSICNLGADLARTGYLDAEAMQKALTSLKRFSGLLASMHIGNVRAVATAAVRDARNGNDFINAVERECGLSITAIDGEEEARLSALGVVANGLGCNGIIGDFGGGSLELIVVENDEVKRKVSLPLGSHRLQAEASRTARINLIETHLERVDFLKDYTGLDFYAMGGAWRSMATAHMNMHKYPLRVLDHYQIDGKKAAEFAATLSKQAPDALEKTVGMSKKRIKDMGLAALAMERLFKKIQPARLVFSGTGLREGLLFDQLDTTTQKQDALLASCRAVARKTSRSDDIGVFDALARWIEPLFKDHGDVLQRLTAASCYLSDGSWMDHEDYQAEHACKRILMLPLYGIDHEGRAFLALTQFVRYKGYLHHGTDDGDDILAAQELLGKKDIHLALTLGLALRLAYLLTGGALDLLGQTELKITSRNLLLKLKGKAALLDAGIVTDALAALAEALDLKASIEKNS